MESLVSGEECPFHSHLPAYYWKRPKDVLEKSLITAFIQVCSERERELLLNGRGFIHLIYNEEFVRGNINLLSQLDDRHRWFFQGESLCALIEIWKTARFFRSFELREGKVKKIVSLPRPPVIGSKEGRTFSLREVPHYCWDLQRNISTYIDPPQLAILLLEAYLQVCSQNEKETLYDNSTSRYISFLMFQDSPEALPYCYGYQRTLAGDIPFPEGSICCFLKYTISSMMFKVQKESWKKGKIIPSDIRLMVRGEPIDKDLWDN